MVPARIDSRIDFFARARGTGCTPGQQSSPEGRVDQGGLVMGNAIGRIVEHEGAVHDLHAMASGGILANRMEPIAQMVPPGTMRLVGDRMDVDEA